MRKMLVVVLFCLASSFAAAQGWRVGDAVQYFDSGWWDAVVVEIGAGTHAGYFKVKADRYSSVQWSAAKNIRARPGKPAAAPATGPRFGDYGILSYGNPAYPPIRLGKITLSAGGAYRFYGNGDNLLGEGRYDYSADTVTWLTGILKDQGWGGGFEVSREGRTHTIRLKRGTVATNSK
jgi:hypothetical protein